jgi:hypothetical protein
MTVSKDVQGAWVSFSGTISEVIAAISDENIPAHKVMSIFWDSTNSECVAICNLR